MISAKGIDARSEFHRWDPTAYVHGCMHVLSDNISKCIRWLCHTVWQSCCMVSWSSLWNMIHWVTYHISILESKWFLGSHRKQKLTFIFWWPFWTYKMENPCQENKLTFSGYQHLQEGTGEWLCRTFCLAAATNHWAEDPSRCLDSGWSVGGLVGWLVGRLAGWLTGWLVECLFVTVFYN